MKIFLLIAFCVVQALASSQCTTGDLTRIGEVSNMGGVAAECIKSNATPQAMGQCFLDNFPGILTVSQNCRTCTVAVIAAIADRCTTACDVTHTLVDCTTCLNTLEADWRSACVPSGAVWLSTTASLAIGLLLAFAL